MSEEERRRCCILGGCGCGPPPGLTESTEPSLKQIQALAEEMAIASHPRNGKNEWRKYSKSAAAALKVFGIGPHVERLRALGLEGKT